MVSTSIFIVSAAAACFSAAPAQSWAADFARQPINARPSLEVRYTDGSRTAFEIVAQTYHLIGSLRTPHRLTDGASGEEWLWLGVTDSDGVSYSSLEAEPDSRINLYRRGPYYGEVHWLDVQAADAQGRLAPIQGDVALYCYPDKVLGSVTWHATEDFPLRSVEVGGRRPHAFPAEPIPAGTRRLFAFPILADAPPLPASAFESIEAVEPVRYDALRGCYTIGSLSEGGFQGHFYYHPNRYETAAFRVHNDDTPRTIYLCHQNIGGDKGSVEGGVLLDEAGHPLPIVVQISKNFAGEEEEKFYHPEDTPFSETYFPLVLDAGEERTVTSLHLYQNWGNHMVKQFSSLGAWMDYFHSSTGVTETTCYVPFKFAGLPGVDIADFRAMSQQAFWAGQPQHDNVAGHSFLSFKNGDDWCYMTYRGTTYRSTGPNWMDIGFEQLSTNGAIRSRIDSFELPQVDELRQFVHVRYEVLKPVRVARPREDFRLLTAASWVQHLRHTHFAATGTDDVALTCNKNHFPVAGHPLPSESSFLAVYGDRKGGNAFILRRWEARVGGVSVAPAASVYCEKKGDTRLLLVVDADDLVLAPGDYFDFEAAIMPFGSSTSADAARREAVAYGTAAPRITDVRQGTKESDFPTRVRAEGDSAEFTIQGGRDVVPVIVTGLSDYRWPRLYRRQGDAWQPIAHRLVSDLDGVQTFVDEEGRFGAVFLVHSDDTPQALRATAGVEPEPADRIRVTPFFDIEGKRPDMALQHAALIQAPWMDTPIHLRFPETLNTDTLDFIDHRRDDMPPRVDPVPLAKAWSGSEGGSWWFEWPFDNQTVGGRLSPNEDSVDLEFWIQNRRDKDVWLGLQFCPVLAGTLFEDRTYERTWGRFNGTWKRLGDIDRGKGDPALCHYRVDGAPEFTVPAPWGLSTDVLDLGVVAVVSPCGRYVFAIAWPDCQRVLTNGQIPCVHSDPKAYVAPAGLRLHVRGKLYLIEGTLDDLLARVRREVIPLGRAAE